MTAKALPSERIAAGRGQDGRPRRRRIAGGGARPPARSRSARRPKRSAPYASRGSRRQLVMHKVVERTRHRSQHPPAPSRSAGGGPQGDPGQLRDREDRRGRRADSALRGRLGRETGNHQHRLHDGRRFDPPARQARGGRRDRGLCRSARQAPDHREVRDRRDRDGLLRNRGGPAGGASDEAGGQPGDRDHGGSRQEAGLLGRQVPGVRRPPGGEHLRRFRVRTAAASPTSSTG